MATAFLPLAHLLAPLQALAAWFAPRPAPAASTPARPAATRRPARVAARAPGACASAPRRPVQHPLRVVRVLEPSAPRAVAGRMVISGRLADVCAELDRLAALEARGH